MQQCVLVVFTSELSKGGILCGNCISSVLASLRCAGLSVNTVFSHLFFLLIGVGTVN